MPAEEKKGEYQEVECYLVPKPTVISWLAEIEGFYETEAYAS